MREKLEEEGQIPACLEHIWKWFWTLSQARTQSANGPNPITYSEIKSWAELSNLEIRPTEIDVLRKLDSTYMEYIAQKQQKESKQSHQQSQGQSKK